MNKKKIQSENSHAIYYTDGTVQIKTFNTPEIRPTPTKEQYLEPVGFKGSIGEWQSDGLAIDSPHFEICSMRMDAQDMDENYISTDQCYANAQLISQSKELAKALQEFVNHCEKSNSNKFFFEKEIANAKQVLKEAGLE